jgi:hypothetical protein
MPCAYISRIRRLAAAVRPPVLDSAESGIADYAFEILAQLKKSVRHRDRRRGGCWASANTLLLPTMLTAV